MAINLYKKLGLPGDASLKELSQRYSDVDIEWIDLMLKFLHTSSELERAREIHFGRYGLTTARFMLLMLLYFHKDGLNPSDSADKLGVTRGNMTKIISGVELDGFIERSSHGKDRRIVLMKLSAKGERLLERILPDHFKRSMGLAKGMTKADRRAFHEALDKIKTGLHFFLDERPK